MSENKALKDRVSAMEKNQKNLAQERDLLKSIVGQGKSAPGTVLMVFALFFAVLIGFWSPFNNRTIGDDQLLANGLTKFSVAPNAILSDSKRFVENEEKLNSIGNSFKSRVLLSHDEIDQKHQHGPNLPFSPKFDSEFSRNIEKFSNKRILSDNETPQSKRRIRNFPSEKFVIVEEENQIPNENRTTKIIRIERSKTVSHNETSRLNDRISQQ